jgi:hypothetical protein
MRVAPLGVSEGADLRNRVLWIKRTPPGPVRASAQAAARLEFGAIQAVRAPFYVLNKISLGYPLRPRSAPGR